jgi:carbamoylphosphate synthase large subunit
MEGRQLFMTAMEQINEKCGQRASVMMTEEAILLVAGIKCPIIIHTACVIWRCMVYLLYLLTLLWVV